MNCERGDGGMKNGHTTRQKTPAGRYALLDELRGLDLVSMMLYHAGT